MKRFILVLCIVLGALAILAACAPVQNAGAAEYARALPPWVIIVGAVVIFCIGFGIIWKLIPGFIKVIALIALAVLVAGVAYGIWNVPIVRDALDSVETYVDEHYPEGSPTPTGTATQTPAPSETAGLFGQIGDALDQLTQPEES